MGGGTRKIEETRKSAKLSARNPDAQGGSGGGPEDLTLPLCERQQQLAIRITTGVELTPGDAVSVVRASPPVIVFKGRVVGEVSDRRQAQVLATCIDAGYLMFGEITTIDTESQEGLASVTGVRARE